MGSYDVHAWADTERKNSVQCLTPQSSVIWVPVCMCLASFGPLFFVKWGGENGDPVTDMVLEVHSCNRHDTLSPAPQLDGIISVLNTNRILTLLFPWLSLGGCKTARWS